MYAWRNQYADRCCHAPFCVHVFSDYLLSNNHVNAIIVHKFDFSDEEVMAYYISFLKTLSFRLNKHTIHFFYNEVGTVSHGTSTPKLFPVAHSSCPSSVLLKESLAPDGTLCIAILRPFAQKIRQSCRDLGRIG